MRLAIISDIHGNFEALKAVVNDINKSKAEKVICLGDVATLGPQPNEVMELLKSLDCPSITGNHESALFNMEHATRYKIAQPVIPVLKWCKNKLSKDDMNFLASFSPDLKISLSATNKLLCFHGSPKSNYEIITSSSPEAQMRRHFYNSDFKYFSGGHSHIQMLRQYNGKLVINPGSVGIPFVKIPPVGKSPSLLHWAEYALVDYSNEVLSVNLKRIPFDTKKLIDAVKKSDMPLKEWWLEQYS